MTLSILVTYILTASAIVASPGPDTILIIRNTLGSGRTAGLMTVVGIQLGLTVHTILAILGLSVLIASSPVLFKIIAGTGAAYLMWLGLQGMISRSGLGFDGSGRHVSHKQAVRDAMMTNLLNPKVLVLFFALFPNFVDYDAGNVTVQLLVLSGILVILNVIWQAPVAFLADIARDKLMSGTTSRWLTHITSAVLMGFAVMMLIDHFL